MSQYFEDYFNLHERNKKPVVSYWRTIDRWSRYTQARYKPRLRICFYHDRIEFRIMSVDRIGMSLAPVAVYRRDKWWYNQYLYDRTF